MHDNFDALMMEDDAFEEKKINLEKTFSVPILVYRDVDENQ